MKKTILLFGFPDLPSVLAVQTAVAPLGIDVIPVSRSDYNKPLAVLAGLETPKTSPTPYAGGNFGGRMVDLCGLMDQVQMLLPILNQAGANCLKAVLTPSNREWNAVTLYAELSREQRAFQGRS